MQKLRTQLLLGYILIFFLMIVVSGIMLYSTNSLISTQELLVHAQSVLSDAHELKTLLVEMETGERGYAITGNADFLQPFNDGGPNTIP